MSRAPTEKQYARLQTVANGAMIISGGDRTLRAMVKRGWLTEDPPGSDNGFRITPVGLRALADAQERYGLAPIKPPDHPTPGPLHRYRQALYEIRRRGHSDCPCDEISQAALNPAPPDTKMN